MPALRGLLEYHRQDVKNLAAFAAIADIVKREENAMFYTRCLMRGHLKFEAMETIS